MDEFMMEEEDEDEEEQEGGSTSFDDQTFGSLYTSFINHIETS